jgi:hypothetical protein
MVRAASRNGWVIKILEQETAVLATLDARLLHWNCHRCVSVPFQSREVQGDSLSKEIVNVLQSFRNRH